MGKRARRAERERRKLGPAVEVDVVAGANFRELGSLIKPALLYADRVRIHSPAAALLHAVTNFADLKTPIEQLTALVDVAELIPSVLPLDVDPETLDGLKAFLSQDPSAVRRVARQTGATAEVNEMYNTVDELRTRWEAEMPRVTQQVADDMSAGDVMAAIRSGAVEVVPLSGAGPDVLIADSLQAAAVPGLPSLDPIWENFAARVVEVVSREAAFPLLDSDASDLVRAMEHDAILAFSGGVAARSSEVHAAARFMGFLPSFPDLPIDEVLDLREVLAQPLSRFRSEMTALSRHFARPIDASFAGDVEAAWRERVAPALADIRESLAEQGLLREVASVALGDVRRLLREAGGVVAASHTSLLDLSALMTVAVAAGAPALDVAGRAVKQTLEARRDVRTQGFYFLHKLDREASKRN